MYAYLRKCQHRNTTYKYIIMTIYVCIYTKIERWVIACGWMDGWINLLDDETNGWMNRKLHEKQPRHPLLYVIVWTPCLMHRCVMDGWTGHVKKTDRSYVTNPTQKPNFFCLPYKWLQPQLNYIKCFSCPLHFLLPPLFFPLCSPISFHVFYQMSKQTKTAQTTSP